MSTKLKLMGVDVASLGDPHGNAPGSRSYQFMDERRQIYKKLVVSDAAKAAGRHPGGRRQRVRHLLQMMLNKIELPETPEFLILPQADGQPPAWASTPCPTTAQICSCNNVGKGAMCAAVADGATTMGAMKSCTSAGTGCGGCVPLVTQIMKAEVKKRPAVNNHVCEHFACSRQELYHLVRVGKIRSFAELMARMARAWGATSASRVAAISSPRAGTISC